MYHLELEMLPLDKPLVAVPHFQFVLMPYIPDHQCVVFRENPVKCREPESYISEQAAASGYKTLVPSNLEKGSNMTVANLFYYFQLQE